MLDKIQLNLFSSKYSVKKNFLSSSEIVKFKEDLWDELKLIHSDYFSSISFDEFFKDKLSRKNSIMRILAFRYMNKKRFSTLMKKTNKDVLINPLFYIFMANRDFYKSDLDKNSILDTQFHYDFPYKIYSTTYWIALEDLNRDTGSLCFSKNDKLTELFVPDETYRNKYNFEKYLLSSKKLDPIISNNTVFLDVEKGSAVVWGSDVLHGASKPLKTNKTRISFNFRTIEKEHLYLSNVKNIRFIEDFNNNIDLFNFLNLMNMGDYKFCERAIKNDSSFHKYKSHFQDIQNNEYKNLIKSNAEVRWQDEYSFV